MISEASRLEGLFKDLYNGSPWIEVNLIDTLKNIRPQKAAQKKGDHNSIWQIVHHLIEWRNNVLLRMKGEVPVTPGHNYFVEIRDTSATAWKDLLNKLDESQKHWINYLQNITEESLDKLYNNGRLNYYKHIMGIVQHDAYHLGQIVLLAKE